MLHLGQYGKRERKEVNRIYDMSAPVYGLDDALDYLASSHNIAGLQNISAYLQKTCPAVEDADYPCASYEAVMAVVGAFKVLSTDGFKQAVKTVGNLLWLKQQIDVLREYHSQVAPYMRCRKQYYEVQPLTVYHSAYTLLSMNPDNVAAAAWSWKEMKNALKNYQGVERYASVEFREYAFPEGQLLTMFRSIIEKSVDFGYTVDFFRDSFSLCEEGMRMQNCIATYWDDPFKDKFIFAVEYKGERADVELSSFWGVVQCRGKSNTRTEAVTELTEILEDIVNACSIQPEVTALPYEGALYDDDLLDDDLLNDDLFDDDIDDFDFAPRFEDEEF